jgi:DMSO/TMAO reductase YedYZ molybdopterin-dependent catalytic subunit
MIVAPLATAGLAIALAWESSMAGGLAYGLGQVLALYWAGWRSQATGSHDSDLHQTRSVFRRRAMGETMLVLGGAGAIAGVSVADAARRDSLTPLAGKSIEPFTVPASRLPGFPVDGQATEVTPVPQFYVVSKNAQDPLVDPRHWRLKIGGLAQRPFTVSFDELQQLPRVSQHVTFQCVSNPVGGSLMSSAYWFGASLRALLERAGPTSSAGRVVFRAPDGHEESVPLEVALREENMVAYAMNGDLLTRLHGHPARAVLPGLYGFKQVKWLTQISIAPESHRGYWPRRGWTDEALIRTTARIDVARMEGSQVLVAGMAFAGRRSISAVQVRVAAGVDGAEANIWFPAELHSPPLSKMTWVQWRALIPPLPASGDWWVEARAVDGEGRPQDSTPSGPFPNGSSGYHRLQVRK